MRSGWGSRSWSWRSRIPVMRANSVVELRIVRALNPPPAAIRWLVTSVFWLGSAGVIVLLVILGLLVPRLAAVRWIAVAALLTWGVCALLGELLGPAAGRPLTGALAGLDTSYPVTQFAVTIAVAATALPYLSRPLHRLVSSWSRWRRSPRSRRVGASGQHRLQPGDRLGCCRGPAPGRGFTARPAVGGGDHRVDHRPGRPGRRHHPGTGQIWGVEKFTGHDPAGEAIELSVYGRDASDARVLAKLWRFASTGIPGPP